MRCGAARQLTLPQIVAGRRVRAVELDIAPGLGLTVLEAADAGAVLDEVIDGDGDPYAAVLWPSAVAAALRLREVVTPSSHVLDVGAGTGIVALAAARLGARATALDHDAFSRAVIAAAAAAQSLHVDILDFDLRSEVPLPHADLIVLADLLYEPELARAAARRTLEVLYPAATDSAPVTTHTRSDPARCRVLIADPARYGRAEYERLMQEAGVAVAFEDIVVRVPGEPAPARVGVALLEQHQQRRQQRDERRHEP